MSKNPPHAASYADAQEIESFLATLGKFERGEMDADAWRAYRVARGAYSQRQEGVHMLRIRIPQGALDAAQLRALADVAARHSRGYGHVTTRQNFQVHFVRPADLEPAMQRLAAAGITTSGSGGNAVRNVVACPYAGVSPDELFDVTPYAEALTRHVLRHPLAMSLPRKFKVAFEGCAHDHVATGIQDLGLRARVRQENGVTERGFGVTVAGGTASLCTAGNTLVEFLPAGDLLALAEAVLRVFHARGDRKNKQRNRLKFLLRELGFEAFRALVHQALTEVRAEGAPRLPFDPERPPEQARPGRERVAPPAPEEIAARLAAAPPRGPGEPPAVVSVLAPGTSAFEQFVATNVQAQRQPGHCTVAVSLPQGDVTSAQLEIAAELAQAYGDGTVRFTTGGQALFRWVPTAEVQALHRRLAAAGLGRDGAGSAGDVIACPGADVCRLSVTRTRGVARLVEQEVRARGSSAVATPLHVAMSGCPNGCSQHHLAAIGLQGSARKLGDRSLPQYFVLLGGSVSASGPAFGKLAGKVPARRIPAAVAALVELYLAERRQGEAAGPFFARSFVRAKSVLVPFEQLRIEDAQAEDFVEPGASEPFKPETQQGECAA